MNPIWTTGRYATPALFALFYKSRLSDYLAKIIGEHFHITIFLQKLKKGQNELQERGKADLI